MDVLQEEYPKGCLEAGMIHPWMFSEARFSIHWTLTE